jgi:hypothetical protein
VGAACGKVAGIRAVSPFEICLLKSAFQPQEISAWKAFRIGVSLPCERERELMAVFVRQEAPTRSETLCYPGTPRGEAFKDRLLPFDCNEVRLCPLLGEFLDEPLPTPRIVVNASIDPY